MIFFFSLSLFLDFPNGTRIVLAKADDIWVERLGICMQAKSSEASCQRCMRQTTKKRGTSNPLFCTHRITKSEKVWRNYSNCGGICNYYKSSQPTKAALSTLHEVHWKLREQKVESCMGLHFCQHCLLFVFYHKGEELFRYFQKWLSRTESFDEAPPFRPE